VDERTISDGRYVFKERLEEEKGAVHDERAKTEGRLGGGWWNEAHLDEGSRDHQLVYPCGFEEDFKIHLKEFKYEI
jgi:hypothetical protein